MFSRLFGKSKLTSADLENLLAQARRHLWRNEPIQSKELFDQVTSEIQAQVQRDNSAARTLAKLNTEAQLGVWAIRYFQDQHHRSALHELLRNGVVDADTAHFVARVFQSRDDTSQQALTAYKTLLSFNSSAALAKRIADLVRQCDYSASALQVLSTVVEILADDVDLMSQLSRWYIIAGQEENARNVAYKVIKQQPKNIDANRCIAILAERTRDWMKAAEHYKTCGDNLRAAVVLSKAGVFTDAYDLIMTVPTDQRDNPTWLYFHGWIAFNQGSFTATLKSWNQLVTANPKLRGSLADSIREAQDQLLFQLLTSPENHDVVGLTSDLIEGSSYQALAMLKVGGIRLIVDSDISGALTLLEGAARLRPRDIHAATYLMVAKAAEQDTLSVDEQIIQKLTERAQDTSLYLWLRGLHMLHSGKSEGLKYLQRACQDGVHKRHLPTEALAALSWISRLINGKNHVSDPQDGPAENEFMRSVLNRLSAPFIQAIMSSYTVKKIQEGQEITWLDQELATPVNPAVWNQVRMASYLQKRDWHRATTFVNGMDSQLALKIISAALHDAVQKQDWPNAVKYVSLGLDIAPDNPTWKLVEQQLRPHMYQMFWQTKQLEILDFALEKQVLSGAAGTNIYHGLAVVYTHLAIAKDRNAAEAKSTDPSNIFRAVEHRTNSAYSGILENQAHNDYWQLAIGYWAVALTDERYWEAWAKRRENVLGETITLDLVRELTQRTIPQMLQSYHQDEVRHGSAVAAHHRFYTSIISREIELTQAVRYLIREAERQQFKLPKAFALFISPLLMKEHGYEVQGREIVTRLSELKLSPYETGLITTAFSPLSDVKGLISIKAYDMALGTLRKLLADIEYAPFHSGIYQELCHVLELASEEAVELERWDDALALVSEGRRLQHSNRHFIRLASAASIGWAHSRIRQEAYSEAVNKLESVRSTLPQPDRELDLLLSDVYVEWAFEAGRDDNTEDARVRFEKAIFLNPDNARAKHGLNITYCMRASYRADEQRDYVGALKDAERALEYHEDAETLVLVARLHRAVANELDERRQHTSAELHWTKAWKHALRHLELVDTLGSMNFLVGIGISRVLSFYSSNDLEDAIRLAERLIEMPYDTNAFDIDLSKLLSELYTSLGAQVYNNGNHWRGKQMMQQALEYDPTNQVARQNLYYL